MIHWFLAKLINTTRPNKRLISLVIDVFGLFSMSIVAIWIRLGEFTAEMTQYLLAIGLLILIALPIFITTGLYRMVTRYVGHKFTHTVYVSVTKAFVIWAIILLLFDIAYPRTAIFIDGLLVLLYVMGTRLIARRLVFKALTRNLPAIDKKKVLIFGAGNAGQQLFTSILRMPSIFAVGFVDDDRNLHYQEINCALVYPREAIPELIKEHGVTEIYLAIPTLDRKDRKELLEWLTEFPVKVLTIPTIDQIASGEVSFTDLKEVSIDELLGRKPVDPRQELLDACILGKSVLVSGAGGSIGSELCRQVLALKPARLVLFEISEFALYNIEQELRPLATDLGVCIAPILGNVQDEQQVKDTLAQFAIETVYHAAAYKHVPLVEHNIEKGVLNNTFGTFTMAKAAAELNVQNFVLISTDKAVRPTNIMGASKRMAELTLQALQLEYASTRFVMVRFGNVLGSSGSVIPLFKKQIEAGGPVTVTHPEITRYFMTIPEAASLVIQAGSMGVGGDVFVLDMGKPVKISDLAARLIHLSGHEVMNDKGHGTIEIRFSGLRPGEKLYEELLIGDGAEATDHPKIMKAHEKHLNLSELEPALLTLKTVLAHKQFDEALVLISQLVSGFNHNGRIVDCYQNKNAICG